AHAAMGDRGETPQLETFTQWLGASRKMRQAALQSCLDRIRSMDPSIHAWVQVQPQRPTGNGRLAEIPFGAKDIIETRGLSRTALAEVRSCWLVRPGHALIVSELSANEKLTFLEGGLWSNFRLAVVRPESLGQSER